MALNVLPFCQCIDFTDLPILSCLLVLPFTMHSNYRIFGFNIFTIYRTYRLNRVAFNNFTILPRLTVSLFYRPYRLPALPGLTFYHFLASRLFYQFTIMADCQLYHFPFASISALLVFNIFTTPSPLLVLPILPLYPPPPVSGA